VASPSSDGKTRHQRGSVDGPKQGGSKQRGQAGQGETKQEEDRSGRKDWRKQENRRGGARRGGNRRSRNQGAEGEQSGNNGAGAPTSEVSVVNAPAGAVDESQPSSGVRQGRRRRKPRRGRGGGPRPGQDGATQPQRPAQQRTEATGMFVLEKGGFGALRSRTNQYMPSRDDVYVPKGMVQRFKLRDGAIITGGVGRGQGKFKRALVDVSTVDDKPPGEMAALPDFKKLTSIDPDFHYALGNLTDDVNLRVIDLICPVGRGSRGLIVAPPRSGKTILLQKFAKGIEEHYPDVHLFVLLVDERPEEATEWQRTLAGEVFVSNNDEMAKNHIQLAEAVWKRCQRLVELGEDVVLVLDSITRLARAYNNFQTGSGRTMSGGLDTRTMEKPKQFFGCARNTETAGSLTILGTTLVETGSRMDQVIFEEFKGTGNMELVLARKLADRRIFPAIDIERSGTRKEEKLISSKQLKRIHTLRRVLAKMNFIEAMELLIGKLDDVETNEEFLQRFEVDPEV
jgi:transcription termination factor Rho